MMLMFSSRVPEVVKIKTLATVRRTPAVIRVLPMNFPAGVGAGGSTDADFRSLEPVASGTESETRERGAVRGGSDESCALASDSSCALTAHTRGGSHRLGGVVGGAELGSVNSKTVG
jgi:hypothetical protein